MAIMVKYDNGTYGHVANRNLDDLIGKGIVVAFRRESGWAQIGRDPIRGTSPAQELDGPDRRASADKRTCLTCAEFVNSMCRSRECTSRTSLQSKDVERGVLY